MKYTPQEILAEHVKKMFDNPKSYYTGAVEPKPLIPRPFSMLSLQPEYLVCKTCGDFVEEQRSFFSPY